MIDKNFLRLYQESMPLKDKGMLKSALTKREEATKSMKHDKGHYALGKANEAVLLGYHIGNGLAAFAAANEALKNVDSFYTISKEWKKLTGFAIFNDIFNIILQWSRSYEEFIKLSKLQVKWIGNNKSKEKFEKIENLRQTIPFWWEAQLSFAYSYFSRNHLEMDKGLYAQGMSILQCILNRSFDEELGYDLSYDAFVHLLDDYIAISLKHTLNIMDKYPLEVVQTNIHDTSEDLMVILENILNIWLKFAPELEEKNKTEFTFYFQQYWVILSIIHKETLMNPIAKYLPDAMINCPNCSEKIADGTPMCKYCGQLTGMEPKDFENHLKKVVENNLKKNDNPGRKEEFNLKSGESICRFVVCIVGIAMVLLIISYIMGII